MSEFDETTEAEATARAMRDIGMDGFLEQMGQLQTSLDKIADGMEALGSSVVRQGKDTENLAAHILALEALMAVILRHIPVDIADVRNEANRRANMKGPPGAGNNSVVAKLAEDLIKRGDA